MRFFDELLLCVIGICLWLSVLTSPVQADEYQLLRFRAVWCEPCQEQIKIFDKADIPAVLSKHTVKDVEIDVDQNKRAAVQWEVRAIPTTILVRITRAGYAAPVKRWGDGKQPLLTPADYRRFVDPKDPWPKKD